VTALGHVAIVGTGQVGTMLGMALRASGDVGGVALFDVDPAAMEASMARGAGDRALTSAAEALDADIVILAAPVPAIVALVEALGPRARPGSLVMDTGSAKRAIVEAMRTHAPGAVHAIGGHPMAGTETPGAAGARADALAGATFALCPVRDDPTALTRAGALAEAAGARPLAVDATEHDRIVAVTSHLPHLMAFALAAVAGSGSSDPRLTAALTSTGFRGATRLAGSDPASTAAFLSANADQVRAAVEALVTALDELATHLDDRDAVRELLAAGGAARARLTGER
jgi:prephenate dehydrogenase